MGRVLSISPVSDRAARRMALMVVLAVLVYGAWASIANLAHGASAAVRAGLTQGTSSGFTTLVIGTVIEAIYAWMAPGRYRALLATASAAAGAGLVHLTVHLAAGTPEVLRTILPSLVMGTVFAALYAHPLAAPARQTRVRLTHRRSATLTPADREAIGSFLHRFVERDRRAFEDKLARTHEVFLGHLDTGELVAFGAVDTFEREVGGRTHGILYSHWAALDPRVRGCNVVHRAGLRYILRYRLQNPLRPLYWMFTASTFQSYLLLVRNFETFWPKPGAAFPARERALVDAVMREGDPDWDPDAGVLRRRGASRYREGVVDDDASLLCHPVVGPAVTFYREKNPGQVEGDSLVCLCPLSAANCWAMARATLRRLFRAPRRPALTRQGAG